LTTYTEDTIVNAQWILDSIVWQSPFPDVQNPNAWYYDHVAFGSHHGIFSGDNHGNFNPRNNLTRAEFVTMLWNMEGQPAHNGTASFLDVSNQWFAPPILWAAENNIVAGSDGRFNPGGQITRQEMAVILRNFAERYLEIAIPQTRPPNVFNDNDQIALWAADAVNALFRAEVINGVGNNNFNPRGNATRAEAAAMLRNFLENVLGW